MERNIGEALILHWKYESGSSVSVLAKHLGVDEETVNRWARRGRIPMRHWKRILQVTGFDLRQPIVC